MNYRFTQVSGNTKTGPIPVTTTQSSSCPNSCSLKTNGCYAKFGNTRMHWDRLDKAGISIKELAGKIKALPEQTLWRHNQAGDIAKPDSNSIDTKSLNAIVKANTGRRGFTYTHCDPKDKANAKAIKNANEKRFTINLSANSIEEADEFIAMNIGPVVTTLPEKQETNFRTPAGNQITICPAYTHNLQCSDCGLCQRSKRSAIVGFPVHGPGKKKAEKIYTISRK